MPGCWLLSVVSSSCLSATKSPPSHLVLFPVTVPEENGTARQERTIWNRALVLFSAYSASRGSRSGTAPPGTRPPSPTSICCALRWGAGYCLGGRCAAQLTLHGHYGG